MIQHFLPCLIEWHPPFNVALFGQKNHLLGSLVLAAGLLEPGGRSLSFNLENNSGVDFINCFVPNANLSKPMHNFFIEHVEGCTMHHPQLITN